MLLVVNTIDEATQCWIEEKQLLVPDLSELIKLLELEDFEFNAIYELETDDLRRLEDRYGFAFQDRNRAGEMSVFDREEFFPENLHTGRELLLMLAGSKPLAAFVEEYPSRTTASVIPEAYFDPHVAAGQLLKKVEISRIGRHQVRRVLYALPDQGWRMDSYLMLWQLSEKHGWNDGFEKVEGFLLGYEPEIDQFFGSKLD